MTGPRTHSGVLFTFRMIPMISAELARRSIDPNPMLGEAALPGDALRGEITAPLARIQKFIDLAGAALGTDMLDWAADEGVAEGTPEAPTRAKASRPWAPRTITCLHGQVPPEWFAR